MTKKIAAMISMVCLAMFTIFSFFPIVFKKIYWKADTPGRGIATRSWEHGKWLFERYPVLGILILVLVIAAIVVLAMCYLGKVNLPQKNSLNYALYLPAAAFVLFILLGILVALNDVPEGTVIYGRSFGYYGYYDYQPYGGFYAMSLCLAVAGVLSILIAIGKVTDEVTGVGAVAQPIPQQPVPRQPQPAQQQDIPQPYVGQEKLIPQPVGTARPVGKPLPPKPQPPEPQPAQQDIPQPYVGQEKLIPQPVGTARPVGKPLPPKPMPPESKIPDEKAFEVIRKYKELLDEGIITQEEYDAKKKELLGL